MSDAIKTAAARIKEDALNLAERARSEAASAFASVNDNRDELRARATETAKLAGEVIAENGSPTDARPGKLIRGRQRAPVGSAT